MLNAALFVFFACKTQCLCIFARKGYIHIVCVLFRRIANYIVCAVSVNRMLGSWFARICPSVFNLLQNANRIFARGCAQTLHFDVFLLGGAQIVFCNCVHICDHTHYVRVAAQHIVVYVCTHLLNYAPFGVQQDRIFVYKCSQL